MISTLHLKNFKSLVDTRIDFRNLTLLMGPNNSGKSSAFQALGFIKQSIPTRGFLTHGPFATLGSYGDIVFRKDGRRLIEISCCVDLSNEEQVELANSFNMPPFEELAFNRIVVIWTFSKTRGLETVCLRDANGVNIFCGAPSGFIPSEKDKVKGLIPNIGVDGLFPMMWSGPGTAVNVLRNVNPLVNRIFSDRFTFKLFYLMSRRGTEVRDQSIGASRPYDVGPHGENAIPILSYIRDDPEFGYLIEKLNEWAKRFGFERIFSMLIAGDRYALTLTDANYKIQSNVVDVGYGTNQLLPVILQCFYAPKGSIILIEEPEMHLHPRLQADLVDLFVDVMNYGNRIAIETHSPNILARLQRRVAEGVIKPQDTGVYYFEKKENGSEVTPIEIDQNGYLTRKLPGFFEEDFKEALERMRAAMKIGGETSGSPAET